MKGRFCSYMIIMLHIMRVISRPLSHPYHAPPPQHGTTAESLSFQFTMSMNSKQVEEEMMKKGEGVEKRIGSRPPSCEDKCYGCRPCEATQVPTTTTHLQYTNYEPEGWKCKCGTTFYAP